MNKKKNNRKIISVLIVLACFVLFAGVLFTGIRNYKTAKKENPVQGVNSESSLKGYLGKGYAYAGAQDNICLLYTSKYQRKIGKNMHFRLMG